ncbi:MAG: DnaJ C-terminal domain-containing protein [Candidatus Daviesbacteria bacterium]
MATKRDYYEILGLNKSAPDAEIKAAYRKLARAHHPDVDKSSGAAERFKEISESYQVLSDPEKRKTYDQFGHAVFAPGGGFGGQGWPGGTQGGFRTYTYTSGGGNPNVDFGGFADPFDLFEQIFGQMGGNPFDFGSFDAQGRQNVRRNPTFQLDLSFDEAIHGTVKEVRLQTENGRSKEMSIKVPAGVDNGVRVRFEGIDIVFRVKRDPQFLREGADIFSDISLAIPQIVLGDVVEVNTVWGKVRLKVPAGTEPGSLIRIKDKGAPNLRGNSRGDHYVRIKLEIPKKLSGEGKDLYEKLSALKSSKKGWF